MAAIPPELLRDPHFKINTATLDTSTRRELGMAWLAVESQLGRRHFSYFSKYVLGHSYEKKFQKQWFDLWDGNDSCTLIGPRGFRKSTMLTEDYLTWRIVRNQNLSSIIISDTSTQAEMFVNLIKTHFENSEELRLIYGDYTSQQQWQSGVFTVRRNVDRREPTCKGVGVEGALVGAHYDIIILDDSVSETSSKTSHQRLKFDNWYYKVVFPALNLPGGEIKKQGTKYHPKDMYWRWITGEDKEAFLVTPCLAINPETGELESIWPELIGTKALLKKRASMPLIAWESQYMGKCDAVEGGICTTEQIKWYNETPHGLAFYNGSDFAVSLKEEACEFSTCTLGVDKQNNVYVEASMHGKFPVAQQLDIIQQHCGKPWNVQWAGVEANGFQLIMPQLFPMFQINVPIKEITHQIPKDDRNVQLRPFFQQGRIFFKDTPGNHDLVDQIVSWYPGSEEADRVDALYNAFFTAFKDVEIGDFESLSLDDPSFARGDVNADYARTIMSQELTLDEPTNEDHEKNVRDFNAARRTEYRNLVRALR